MRGSGGSGSRHYRARARPHFFPDLDMSGILQPADPAEGCFVASKVVATLGPACSDVDTLARLLEAGMTVARVDLTWGPLDYHKRSLTNLNTAMKRVRRMCAVMVDTLGREMLIRRPFSLGPDGWPQHESPFKVAAGSGVTITTSEDAAATPALLPITYPKFPSLVQPGDIVYIGRYMACGAPEMASLYLRVEQVHEAAGEVVCVALNDAELHGLLTVFNLERSASELTSLQSDLPVLTQYDRVALRDLADTGFEIDFICISYCRSGVDVREVRAFAESVPALAACGLVAKVETRQALFNFRGILEAADGITISRGLLGLDCLPEKVALIQKSLISACNLVGKPVVVTRVLDSMADMPRPTRAEATDVANAVLDGADALWLGAETLRGKWPVETVRTLVSIARQAEKVFDFAHHFEWLMQAAVDAQELRESLTAGGGMYGGGGGSSMYGGIAPSLMYGGGGWGPGGGVYGGGLTLDDDDAATDIFMLHTGDGLGGYGGMQPSHMMGGSIGAGLSGLGGGGGGGYGNVGGLTPLGSMTNIGGGGATGGGGAAAADGAGGLSPASLSTANLEDLAAMETPPPAAAGSGTANGGGGGNGQHVSFAALPPRAPPRSRSNASMPDVSAAGGGGTAATGGVGGGGGAGSLSASGGSPLTAGGGAGAAAASGGPGGGGGGGNRSQSYADINTAVAAMNRFGPGPGGGGGGGGSIAAEPAGPVGAAAALPGGGRQQHSNPLYGGISNAKEQHREHHGHPHSHHSHSHHGHGHAPSGRASSPSVRSTTGTVYGGGPAGPYMGKLESIASSAVRAAEKVKASLIVVYTHTSRVASLVAKYRPPMPILTLVVPRLTSDGLHWKLQGKGHARQCLLVRGLLPMLSAPGPSGDEVLEEAIALSSRLGLVGPGHFVVVVERVHDAFCLKIVAVDELGLGIQREDGALADPTATVVRAMVPATPVIGRTLSMMGEGRSRRLGLPPATAATAALAAAAAAAAAAGAGAGGGGTSGGGGAIAALGPLMGSISSLLAASPSCVLGAVGNGGRGGGRAGGSGGGGGGAAGLAAVLDGGGGSGSSPRRLTSAELINVLPGSPFSGSPPMSGGGAAANRSGGGPGGGAGSSSDGGAAAGPAAAAAHNAVRLNLLNTLYSASNYPGSAAVAGEGGGGGGGATAIPAIQAAALAAGSGMRPRGAATAATSADRLPVINALGGGTAAHDTTMLMEGVGGGGGSSSGAAAGSSSGAVRSSRPGPLGSVLLGPVTEEPEPAEGTDEAAAAPADDDTAGAAKGEAE
ncbi:hypothetical protein CHLRE_10g426292v5 [Chlamydomonas reinhardtii]|uniref:Pyruvate kinase n=1 Tax=Chlamydomonas reinhardtii TaxID=3055 RepID=A0A2K3D9J3_CHLRE|nr:uncharacterized protein CHLRE_10g426292v5 [Chlamydomonas reinhardtii]PNW77193.1 hypothetical protein CHLRE_10g426292v5 [Chlamydomonas reinhardtii]